MKFLVALPILFLYSFTYGQLHNYNPKDTFFYFAKYDFYLNKNNTDTSKLYLKQDSKLIDVKKISGSPYDGVYEFAKFKINKTDKSISVVLFDINKNELTKEVYHFKNIVSTRSEKYFYNLTPGERIIVWKIITPFY